MFKRTAGISEEVGRELVKKLEEFGWNASDVTPHNSISASRERLSIEIPIETILSVEYSSDAPFGGDKGKVDRVELELGTRSTMIFLRDGYFGIKI